MSFLVPVTGTADYTTVVAASTTFDTTMESGFVYMFTSTTDCMIKQSAAGDAASAGDDSMLVVAGASIAVEGSLGAKLSVIRVIADGTATLTRARRTR